MGEMIDRVARAILTAERDIGDNNLPPWSRAPAELKASLRRSARAVIQAMREPNAHMFDAALPHADMSTNPSKVWRAMIDAALEDA
jgi:hypothetical protein